MRKLILALLLLVTVSISFFFAAKPKTRERFFRGFKSVPEVALLGFDTVASGKGPVADLLGSVKLSRFLPVLECTLLGGARTNAEFVRESIGKPFPYGELFKTDSLRFDCSGGGVVLRLDAEGAYVLTRRLRHRIEVTEFSGTMWMRNIGSVDAVVDLIWDWGSITVRLAPAAAVKLNDFPTSQMSWEIQRPGVSLEVKSLAGLISKQIRFETNQTEYAISVAGQESRRKNVSSVLSSSGLADLPVTERRQAGGQ